MIKVNILTGFFGSGKTTLISNIIKNEEIKKRIAIIQNEFSEEMGIEKDTLLDSEGNDLGNIIEMPNGCLCCVVKDNLVVFIENLIKKMPDINYVIIESHGFTDVSNLIKKFWLDKELESPVHLNSIICLVDCFNFEMNKNENEEIFSNQIISADKVILNKTDLLNDETLIEHIKSDIKNLNPLAAIYTTNYSNIPFDFIFEDSKNSPFNKLNENILYEKENLSCDSCQEGHNHKSEKKECTHLKLMENFILKTDIENLEELDKRIGKLLWEISEEHNFKIIRFKGIIRIKDEENDYKFTSLQGLYDLYEFTEIKLNENNNLFIESQSGNFKSKILFIGKDIKKNIKIFEEVFQI